MKIRSRYNYDPKVQDYENNNLPSLTIPDDIPSLSEIVDKHARGIPLDIPMYNHYDDDDDIDFDPILDGVGDLTDKETLQAYSEDIQERYKNQQKAYDEISENNLRTNENSKEVI